MKSLLYIHVSAQPSRGKHGTQVASRGINTHIVYPHQLPAAGTTLRGAGALLQVGAVIVEEAEISILGAETTVSGVAAAVVGVSVTRAAVRAHTARSVIGVVDGCGRLDSAGWRR